MTQFYDFVEKFNFSICKSQVSQIARVTSFTIYRISLLARLVRLMRLARLAMIFSREASLIFHKNYREKNCERRLTVNSTRTPSVNRFSNDVKICVGFYTVLLVSGWEGPPLLLPCTENNLSGWCTCAVMNSNIFHFHAINQVSLQMR
jgi:hypothetical protein